MSSIPSSMRRPDPTFIAGAILVVVTLLAAAVMAHHPTVGRTPDLVQSVRRIAALSRPSAWVHGTLIALLLVTLHCLFEFASTRGFARPLVRSGAIAYATGAVVMIGAALVSGFVIADVASLVPHETPVDLQIVHALLILCGILNQACANFGAIAMSAGIGLWSLDLLRDRGLIRLVGMLGCVIGLVPVIALPIGAIHLDVHGMLGVVLLQALWNLAIAALLLRARAG